MHFLSPLNKVMNFNTYGAYYGKFHRCTVSSIRQNVIQFDFGTSPYESWFVSRMHPSEIVSIDSTKPLLLALKAFFQSDVPASVVYNRRYLWTICLGNGRVVYPIDRDLATKENSLQFYATPYYVSSLESVAPYLQGTIKPAYENVFFYKNTVLFLDNEDLPYPGGYYFHRRSPHAYYRICFLSNEPAEYVLDLAAEWRSRRDVLTVLYMTREVRVTPKFIDFQPVSDFGLSDASVASTGIVYRSLSSRKPEHLIQDVLRSYYKNVGRQSQTVEFNYVGLLIEWPMVLGFEGGNYNDRDRPVKQFVALSVNGTHPDRVLYVTRPYDRYSEHTHVPATLWTPIQFALSTLLVDPNSLLKVAIDSVVLGVVYRKTFFCFSHPLLEGRPTKVPILNGQYLVSTVTFNLSEDASVQVLETFKLNDRYSLHRVSLSGLSTPSTWCLSASSNTDPYPRKMHLPGLVKLWTDFFMQVEQDAFDVDVSAVRLTAMLSKHSVCFNLNARKHPQEVVKLSDNQVHFFLEEEIVEFINNARLVRNESPDTNKCILS